MTASGGIQKEAFFFHKPCVTMRDQTEWIELIDNGANKLAGANTDLIIELVKEMLNQPIKDPQKIYGGGTASVFIADYIAQHI